MDLNPGISARAVGQYPVSISTSLALEGAFGIHPDLPPVKSAPILEYEQLFVNMRTLFRNFLGAMDKVSGAMVSPDEIAITLNEEMEQITEIVNEGSNGRCKPVFYLSKYKGMAQAYPYAAFRVDSTDRMKANAVILKQTMALIAQQNRDRDDPILIFDRKLTPEKVPAPKTLIITHHAYDLLSYRAFRSLSLLESHTGRIKDRALWYTKYSNGRELAQIPFREDLIQVMGDGETFRTLDPKLRKEVLELATRFNWSAVTTSDRIRFCADFIKDAPKRDLFKSLLVAP
ncbi:hypothetical protein [Paraburkholderia sp. BCC1886]|uniref:hypothetical protein n=1 Tax=Paraburkholderia sp. BCC1886 TaxID=2562670 RepID=UPI00118278D4|nr:hypothetical protein [Paraburkholderia sp. BCC1886]